MSAVSTEYKYKIIRQWLESLKNEAFTKKEIEQLIELAGKRQAGSKSERS